MRSRRRPLTPAWKKSPATWAINLPTGVVDGAETTDVHPDGQLQHGPDQATRQAPDEIRMWTDEQALLSSATANRVRRWICETVAAQLQNGPYGVAVSKVKSEWRIGSHTLRATDVVIERAQGGGAVEPPNPFRIDATDENAALIRGILAAASGGSLDLERGRMVLQSPDQDQRLRQRAGRPRDSGSRHGTTARSRGTDRTAPHFRRPRPDGPRRPDANAGTSSAATAEPGRGQLPPRSTSRPRRGPHRPARLRHGGQGHRQAVAAGRRAGIRRYPVAPECPVGHGTA